MKHPASRILFNYLVEAAVASTPQSNADWPVFYSTLPNHRSVGKACVAVLDSLVENQGRLMTGEPILKPRVQFLVRSHDYAEAFGKAEIVSIFLDLLYRYETVIDGDTYTVFNCSRMGDALNLGQDEDSQYMISLNYRVSLARAAANVDLDNLDELVETLGYNLENLNGLGILNYLVHNQLVETTGYNLENFDGMGKFHYIVHTQLST